MKCPIDKTEMEKGVARVGLFFNNEPRIIAYRCPKCGKVELTTEADKEGDKASK